MPNTLLSVPHFEQSRDGMCLPACSRMILAYWRHNLSERKLARLLKTDSWGTPISNIQLLSKLRYDVDFGSFSQDKLLTHLNLVWTPF